MELAFLAEYAKTMSPVAKALDVLQGETSVQMGWLVPTITLLRTKLQQLHVTSKYCEPLIAALLSGLEKRFRDMLADPELIAAAILVPKFKTCWTSDEHIIKLGKCLTSLLPLNTIRITTFYAGNMILNYILTHPTLSIVLFTFAILSYNLNVLTLVITQALTISEATWTVRLRITSVRAPSHLRKRTSFPP